MKITFRTDIASALDLKRCLLWGDEAEAIRPLIQAIDAAIAAENASDRKALEER